MNDTKKTIKKSSVECTDCKKKLLNLHRLLLGMNAYGSLDLDDFHMIEDYLKGAFNFSNKIEDDE